MTIAHTPPLPRLIGVLATALALTACASVRTADPSRGAAAPARLPADAWPQWRTHDLGAIAQTLDGPQMRDHSISWTDDAGVLQTVTSQSVALLACDAHPAGCGIVRRVNADLRDDGTPRIPGARPDLEFIAFKEGSGDPERALAVDDVFDFDEHGRRFTPLPPLKGGDPVGLLIHIHGLASAKQDAAVRDAFRERGWYALDGSFVSMFTSDAEVRFDDTHDRDAVAAGVARLVDARLAERAQAVEAIIEYMRAHEPGLAGKPVVIAGYSAGALAVPTIVAYRPDLYDAAIIVAGGANILEVSNNSSFASVIDLEYWPGGIPADADYRAVREAGWQMPRDERPWRTPTPEIAADLAARYLVCSRLDPYHAAPTIADVPVLHLYGRKDTWVPAANAEALDDRLGGCECWRFPGGHRMVFWRLPSLATRIARWAERASAPGDAG